MLRTAIATTALLLSAGLAQAQGDATAGEQVFKKCAACHAVGENAKNKMGPELNGLVGRTAGSLPDYNYSAALKDAGAKGMVWTAETLTPWLTKPKDVVPGTKMTFGGLPKPEDVANVIAYLATFAAPAQ